MKEKIKIKQFAKKKKKLYQPFLQMIKGFIYIQLHVRFRDENMKVEMDMIYGL